MKKKINRIKNIKKKQRARYDQKQNINELENKK